MVIRTWRARPVPGGGEGDGHQPLTVAEGVGERGGVLPVVGDGDAQQAREGGGLGLARQRCGGLELGERGKGGLADAGADDAGDVSAVVEVEGGGFGEGGERSGHQGEGGAVELRLIDGAQVLEDAHLGGLAAGRAQGGKTIGQGADQHEHAEDEDGHGEQHLRQREGGGGAARCPAGGLGLIAAGDHGVKGSWVMIR